MAFVCQWPTISSGEAEDPHHCFVLALYAEAAYGSEANKLQLHEVLEDWDWDQGPARVKGPDLSVEPVAEYNFDPDPGWKLFDVTTVVRAHSERGNESLGVILRFADSSQIPEGTSRTRGRYGFYSQFVQRSLAPFRPVLLVLKAGDVTE